MDELMIKDIDFNGSLLRAAQDKDNIIWVGIRWICNGLGLSESRTKYERKKLQEDLVLSKGTKFCPLGNDKAQSDVLCLKLDFLPLWLAKISITPKMKKENPDLANKLVEYQLKAKDVLAEAFLNNKKELPEHPVQQTVLLQFPSYDEQFSELNKKIDKLYNDMGLFVKTMLDWKESKAQTIEEDKIIDAVVNKYSGVMRMIKSDKAIRDRRCWKRKINNMIYELLALDKKYGNKSSNVTKEIYAYMRKNYGIVWEQDIKEYKERYALGRRPKTMDVVYENETYRSIFESVLIDLIGNTNAMKVTDPTLSIDNIIRPLIEISGDVSKNGTATYRRIYKHMQENHKIDWEDYIAKYMKNNKTNKKPSKKELIITDPQLRKSFEESVNEFLNDQNKEIMHV